MSHPSFPSAATRPTPLFLGISLAPNQQPSLSPPRFWHRTNHLLLLIHLPASPVLPSPSSSHLRIEQEARWRAPEAHHAKRLVQGLCTVPLLSPLCLFPPSCADLPSLLSPLAASSRNPGRRALQRRPRPGALPDSMVVVPTLSFARAAAMDWTQRELLICLTSRPGCKLPPPGSSPSSKFSRRRACCLLHQPEHARPSSTMLVTAVAVVFCFAKSLHTPLPWRLGLELKEICPRGNNKVIIYFLIIMINVYYSC